MQVPYNLLLMLALMQSVPTTTRVTNSQTYEHWSSIVSQVNGRILNVKGNRRITLALPLRPDFKKLAQLVAQNFFRQGCLVAEKSDYTPRALFTLEVDPQHKKLKPFNVTCKRTRCGNVAIVIG